MVWRDWTIVGPFTPHKDYKARIRSLPKKLGVHTPFLAGPHTIVFLPCKRPLDFWSCFFIKKFINYTKPLFLQNITSFNLPIFSDLLLAWPDYCQTFREMYKKLKSVSAAALTFNRKILLCSFTFLGLIKGGVSSLGEGCRFIGASRGGVFLPSSWWWGGGCCLFWSVAIGGSGGGAGG